MKSAALIELLSCLQTGYGGLSLAIRVFRAVGHRKGGKQLLNPSAGLVRTVVRNELIVHGRLVQSKEPTILRSSLGPTIGVLENQRTPLQMQAFSM